MADTGDTHPSLPGPWPPIKRTDLRVECQRCGGVGSVTLPESIGQVLFGSQHLTVSRVVKCPLCFGNKIFLPTTILK